MKRDERESPQRAVVAQADVNGCFFPAHVYDRRTEFPVFFYAADLDLFRLQAKMRGEPLYGGVPREAGLVR